MPTGIPKNGINKGWFKKGQLSTRGMLGKKHSKEWKEERRQAMLGDKNPMKKLEVRKKRSEAQTSEKNPNWRGDLTRLERLAGRKKPNYCEICGVLGSDFKKGLCFDHDHNTGEFRGWICTKCNTGLGMANDDVKILKLWINYLNK